jgi:hypothetical protein
MLRVAVLVLLLQQLPVPQIPQPQSPKGLIEGTVLRSASGEPLDRARVTLQRMLPPPTGPVATPPTPPPAIPPVQTERDGKFSFKDLEAGQYRLRVQRNGYAPQEYGQRAANSTGTVINLAEGQQMKETDFRLIAAAIVTGRVRDTNGEPVPGSQVSLLRTVYNTNGQRNLTTVGNATTDDRGEYRIFWVPPGRYLLSVRSGLATSIIMLSGGEQIVTTGGNSNVFADRNFPPTYYPGTLDPSRAAILDLQSGAEMSAVDFVLIQPPTLRIRGRVVDATTGKSPQNSSVMINPRQEPGAPGIIAPTGTSAQATYNNATGTFEIRNVIPGLYWLRASTSTDLNQPVNVNVAGTARTAMELVDSLLIGSSRSTQIPIEVGNSDIEGVTLTLSPGLSIPAYVQFEGQELSSVTGLDRVRVNLRPTTTGAPAPYQALSFNAEGATTLTNVSPGEYRVQASPPSPEMYLKEVLFDRQDVLTRPWEITSQTSGALTLIFSNKGGQIQGNLVDTLSQPVRGSQVVLIPDQGRDRPELYKTSPTDQNGRFTFRGIAPGGYRLFAWEVIEANSWYDREVLAEYESRSTPVRVKESTTETVDLKIIAAPK